MFLVLFTNNKLHPHSIFQDEVVPKKSSVKETKGTPLKSILSENKVVIRSNKMVTVCNDKENINNKVK